MVKRRIEVVEAWALGLCVVLWLICLQVCELVLLFHQSLQILEFALVGVSMLIHDRPEAPGARTRTVEAEV